MKMLHRVVVFSAGVLVSFFLFGLPKMPSLASNADVAVHHDIKIVLPDGYSNNKRETRPRALQTTKRKERARSRVPAALKYSEDYREGESVDSLLDRLSAEYPPSAADSGGPALDLSLKRTIVMTGECKTYLNWQQIVAVESLKAMNEKADVKFNIVRLVACALRNRGQQFGAQMRRISHYHLTPDFSGDGKIQLGTANKPASLYYWMRHGSGKRLSSDHEIIVVDSDFMFFNQIPYPLTQPGKPAAAHFDLPRVWWKAKSIRRYCQGKCGNWDSPQWQQDNSMGPPYAMRKSDADILLALWFKFTWAMKMDVTSTEFPDPQAPQPAGWYMDMFAYHLAVEVSELHHEVVWGWFLVTEHEIWHKLAELGKTEADVWCIHYPAIYATTDYFPKEEVSMRFWKHFYHEPTFYSCDKEESYKYIWRGHDQPFKPPQAVLKEGDELPGPIIYQGDSLEVKQSRIIYLLWRIHRTVNAALTRWRSEISPKWTPCVQLLIDSDDE